MNFCTCGKLAYIQRLNSLGILEYLCLEHIDQKTREAIYGSYEDNEALATKESFPSNPAQIGL